MCHSVFGWAGWSFSFQCNENILWIECKSSLSCKVCSPAFQQRGTLFSQRESTCVWLDMMWDCKYLTSNNLKISGNAIKVPGVFPYFVPGLGASRILKSDICNLINLSLVQNKHSHQPSSWLWPRGAGWDYRAVTTCSPEERLITSP